jgi:SAM-dependent methyltransferase/uncharacterized protein YbaR (Trm112 family)
MRERVASLPSSSLERAEQLGLLGAPFGQYVESGLFLCEGCRLRFPILYGLPVLLPYATALHSQFADSADGSVSKFAGYAWPSAKPVSGEEFVMRSFSQEWLEYDYDGVIWDLSYEDHEQRLLAEIGLDALRPGARFLEIGCGLGMSTAFAQKALRGDAIGVDLSLAVLSATRHFAENPFLHFVQGSVFNLPLRKPLADIVYSHGVLHHTYSTREAFLSIVPFCRPGATVYIWLYATASTKGSIARRVAWQLERLSRPLISRHLDSLPARGAMALFALPYLVGNAWHRFRDASVQKYDFQRALHAARDRFTPLYAHRQDFDEIAGWFREAGFESIAAADWQEMPTANQDNFRRNVGVRGRLPG